MSEHVNIDNVNLIGKIQAYMDGVNIKQDKSYHHGNLKAELVEAGLQILDKEGVEALGIRQIARKVGVAHSAPANHFKNKQALLTALVDEVFCSLLLTVESESAHGRPVDKALRCFCQRILDYALNYPNRYRLMWRRELLDTEDKKLAASRERIYEHLRSFLKEQAVRKNLDVDSLAIAVWSLIHGYVSLRLDGNLEPGKDSLTGQDRLDALVDVLLKGVS